MIEKVYSSQRSCCAVGAAGKQLQVRIADDIVLDNLAANDNQPSGNPDPRVELFGLVQLRHPLGQRQPASSGTFGIV